MPYCRRCGKQIETNAEYCEECRNQSIYGNGGTTQQQSRDYRPEQSYQQQSYQQQPCGRQDSRPEENNGRMDGFGKALASTILGAVATVLVFICYYIIGVSFAGSLGVFGSVALLFAILGFVPACIATSIISIVCGIKSIKTFANSKNNGRAKPIATLILGINGLADGALSAFLMLLFVFVIEVVL